MSPNMTPAGYSPHERLPTAENPSSSLSMALQYNGLAFPTETMLGYNETFISQAQPTYLHENPMNMAPDPPQQAQNLAPNDRIKMESSFTLVSPSHSESPGIQQSTRSIPDKQPPPLTMHEFNLNLPNPPRGRGRGRGKGNAGGDSDHAAESVKRGKGRAATQGVLVPIIHVGRQEALAEQAAKRKRVDLDEPYDDSDERALQELTTETTETPQKKQKSEAPAKGAKRGHTACDRCVRNKTKCHRQVDGKPPGKSFPCDFCANINGICTTAMAAAVKPEALTVAEESHWKTWKFKEVITDAMETENLRLRKQVASFEERFNHQDRVHEAVKSELNSQKAHRDTLQSALENANTLVKSREFEILHHAKLLRDAYRKCDELKERLKQYEFSESTVHGGGSVADDSEAPSVVGRMMVFRGGKREEESPKVRTSVDVALSKIRSRDDASDDITEESVIQTKEANNNDIIQTVRQTAKKCYKISQLNEYMKAYFANVHPLLPILHKEAFLRLYKLYALKALPHECTKITDGSSRDGRAVSLIASVLALGAFSLVETRTTNTAKEPAHFGESLEFYSICLRLLSYTHDTLETMMAYLLMGVFAIQTADIKEAFRRLNQFQTQAVGLNLRQALIERNPEEFYDQDLWPGVTQLVVSEMAKRSWSMFRVYLSNVAMELGRRSNFYEMDIPSPKLVDDEYFGFDVSAIEADYENAPNPIKFILVLQDLSTIVDDYTKTAYTPHQTTRHEQIEKYRRIWNDLQNWKQELPSFLDWKTPSSGLSSRSYLALQRALLETHYWCIKMKLSWSVAHLDSMLMAKFQSLWDVGNTREQTFKAGERVIKIVEETGLESDSYHCFHWDIVRALTTLLQILLRNQFVEAETTLDDLVELCRNGIDLSRKLVPDSLTKAEGLLESALDQYLTRRTAGQFPDTGFLTFADPSDCINPIAHDNPFTYDNRALMHLQHGFGDYGLMEDYQYLTSEPRDPYANYYDGDT